MGVRTKEAVFLSVWLQHRKEKVRILLNPSENFIRTITLLYDSLLFFKKK